SAAIARTLGLCDERDPLTPSTWPPLPRARGTARWKSILQGGNRQRTLAQRTAGIGSRLRRRKRSNASDPVRHGRGPEWALIGAPALTAGCVQNERPLAVLHLVQQVWAPLLNLGHLLHLNLMLP